jgi:hypothetical protein
MKQNDENPELFVQRQVEKLRQAPLRNLEKAARGRSQYLAQARLAAARVNSQQAVSNATPSRLNGWIGLIRNPLRRKEQYSMIGVFSSLVVILALLMGGAGATVYAAQDSLPNQGLYPLKIASEAVQLRLANNEQTQLNLQLAYADRRVSELAALMAAGEPAPEQVANRLENHLRQALQLAGGMDGDALPPALLQIRTHMRSQERLMEMMHSNMPAAADPVLARVRLMLRQQINLVDEGLADPQSFRNRLQYQYRELVGTPHPETTPAATGNSYGPGPGSGPGTQSCGECTPVMDGTGPGPGPGPQQNGQTPEPGQGQSSGPGPAATPSQAPGGSGGGEGGGGPSATQEPGGGNPNPSQEPGGGGSPSPSQDPGGQGSGGSAPGGGQGHP